MKLLATIIVIAVWVLCVITFSLGFTAGRQTAPTHDGKPHPRCNFLKLT